MAVERGIGVVMSAEDSPAGEPDSGSAASDKDFSCPTCDDVFSTEVGMKIHHAQGHGESIARVETTCKHCDSTYRVYKFDLERSNFCSKNCLYEWRSENHVGKNSPSYNRVTIECGYCGDSVEKPPCEVEQSENQFCGRECFYQWRSEEFCGPDHQNWVDNTKTFVCEWCGDEYENEARQEGRTRFCSQDCLTDWQSQNLSGENSVHWKGGYKHHYGANWRRQREKAWKRDQYRCCICGADERTLGRKPSVHHIQRIGKFREKYDAPEWFERANDLSNLISLCQKHHMEWEGIPLRPQVN